MPADECPVTQMPRRSLTLGVLVVITAFVIPTVPAVGARGPVILSANEMRTALSPKRVTFAAHASGWTAQSAIRYAQKVLTDEANRVRSDKRVARYHVLDDPPGLARDKAFYVTLYEIKAPAGSWHGRPTYDEIIVQYGDGSNPEQYLHSIALWYGVAHLSPGAPLDYNIVGTNGAILESAGKTHETSGDEYGAIGKTRYAVKGTTVSTIVAPEYDLSLAKGPQVVVNENLDPAGAANYVTSATSPGKVAAAFTTFAHDSESFIHQYG